MDVLVKSRVLTASKLSLVVEWRANYIEAWQSRRFVRLPLEDVATKIVLELLNPSD